MEKLMKTIYVALTTIMLICSVTVTIVSVCRLEWASLWWLIVAVMSAFIFKGAIGEYKEKD